MKKLLSILAFPFLLHPVFAQGQDELPPKAREKIQAARIAFITERLELTPEEAEKFWPVYREFIQKRQGIHHKLVEARNNPNPKLSVEENDKHLLDLSFKVKEEELALEKEYSSQLLKTISAKKLVALRQAEEDFKRLVLEQIRQRQQGNKGPQRHGPPPSRRN